MTTILDQYVRTPPDIQNALDIFVNEWTSRLPVPFTHYRAGTIPLFEDPRVEWGVKSMGGLAGRSVLELGPLEAGHTYMIERLGAASVCAVEANTRSFLKCLIVKEVLDLKRTRFLCGDFVEYLKHEPAHFDVAFASGVLYHMQNPAELIALLSKTADRLFVWSHYYDGETIRKTPSHRADLFAAGVKANYHGFEHMLYRRQYPEQALLWSGYCGGHNTFSHWLSRDDLLGCFRHFGFEIVEVGCEEPSHPNGPAFALTAVRRK
jgi:hypothetical protein